MSDDQAKRPTPSAGMPGMQNMARGGQIQVNRRASRVGELPGAVTSAPASPAPGAASPLAPTIVRPTASRVITQGAATTVTKDAGQQRVSLTGVQVGRWYSGDAETARTVRVTVTGEWTTAPGLSGSNAQALGVMVFVKWGSQSGGTQQAWFPVPCDFEVSATDVQVSASICLLPYAARPRNFSGNAIAAAAAAQIVCSISESDSGDVPTFMLAGGSSTAIDASGSNRLADAAHVPTIATDLILQNTGANDTYVALMDLDPTLAAGTKGPLVMTPVLVPAGGQVAVAWEGLAIWNAPWIGAFTSADGLMLDAANAPNVFYEVRGWTPGFQGGVA